MNKFASNSVIGVAGILLAAGFSAVASAEHAADPVTAAPAAHVRSASIPYSQADLSTDEGRQSLYRQIKRAAKSVCGPTGLRDAGGLTAMTRNRKCYDDAVSAAVSQVDSGRFTAMLD